MKGSEKNESFTVPNLELCAALLLAQLLHRLHGKITSVVPISRVRAWTDSFIVLSWLTADQKNFKIFVTNCVAKIHSLVPDCKWLHVTTKENPADPSSRGLLLNNLVLCNSHWKGPYFIHRPEVDWPRPHFSALSAQQLQEVKATVKCMVAVREAQVFDEFLSLFRRGLVFSERWRTHYVL